MKKKKLAKLCPGTIVEVHWVDSPPEAAMLVDEYCLPLPKGLINVTLFYPGSGTVNRQATHKQIKRVLKAVDWPVPTDLSARFKP